MRIPDIIKELDVRMVLSRCSNEDEDFNLFIIDNISHIEILRIKIPATNIANLLSQRPAAGRAEYCPSGDIGKEYKHITYIIMLEEYGQTALDAALKKEENRITAAGWIITDENRKFNGHKYGNQERAGGHPYILSVHRWDSKQSKDDKWEDRI